MNILNRRNENVMQGDQIEELARALNESKFSVAITGAGISIAAGGVTYSGMHLGGSLGGRDMLSGDSEKMYAAFWQSFLKPLFEHGPTEAHKALATLESEGKMQGIITTNVDCMHTAAGSKNVAEIQGSFQTNVCTGCGKWVYGYVIWNHGEMPRCENCNAILLPYNIYSHAGILEPELVKAQEWIAQADLILIIGASGCYTHLYWSYKKRDAKIIQINPKRTYFDGEADLNIHEESDPVFEKLLKEKMPALPADEETPSTAKDETPSQP